MSELEKIMESGLLDEDTVSALKEAIDQKVNSRLNTEKEKLREEFGRRYEYDKQVMIEAADKMFTEQLESELAEVRKNQQELIEQKVRYKKMMKEHAKAIQKFVADKLVKEIQELRNDRKGLAEALVKFEKFAVKQMTRELTEFHQDKRDLVETRVKLVKEADSKIRETKDEFVKRASLVVEGMIQEVLKNEIKTFRQDIKEARKNNFGRRLFEAFQAEFMASHQSDGTQMKKLMSALKERESKLEEAVNAINESKDTIKKLEAKRRLAESNLQRHKKLGELLGALPKNKRALMSELLESTPTERLDESYKKHLKYVLEEEKSSNGKKSLMEDANKKNVRSVATGNRKQEINESSANDDEELRRMAQLAKVKY